MIPNRRQLLPELALISQLQREHARDDNVEYSQHRRINVATLVRETLELMEENGGPGSSTLIKSHVPSFHRSDEVLHRGFR